MVVLISSSFSSVGVNPQQHIAATETEVFMALSISDGFSQVNEISNASHTSSFSCSEI